MKNKKPDHNSIVAKSNDLVTKLAKFDLPELRLIAYCLAHYDSRKPENRTFTAKITDLVKYFLWMRIVAYTVIYNAMLELNNKPLVFDKGNERHFWNWFSGFIYKRGKGEFEFRINPDIQPYLLELKDCFSIYRLADVYQFKSAYTWKLYENLNRWKKNCSWYVEIKVLKAYLGADKKYSRFNSFRERILDPAIEEINEKSDLNVGYEKEIDRNSVVALKFFLFRKPTDDIIEIDNPENILSKMLLVCGIKNNIADSYIKKICELNKENHFIKKVPEIRARWNEKKGLLPKYMLGGINKEIEQINLDVIQEGLPEYHESLSCWHNKKLKKEICKVRERGIAGNRKKCQICLEKIPVATFGV
ncbi:MAG: Initiator Replication protein [Candidatus Electronema aureum]|uniref:Initiator Replication protein n=1 Tax=Candidatus Electronema aureum TaxID=2005002 RepID=A0A521FZE2_9BACT|nr:MAG: Initiator Replication protein [Candidatus Electronema aureum]